MAVIDLRRLRAFVALAEEGHVTRAAERLGMQQPPLTRLLQGLEAELSVLLMHRLPRGVRPTEAGKVLLDEARLILARADGVADRVHRAARGEEGSLAIGFTSSAALHPFVPKVLRAFRESLPGVEVSLEEAGTAELVEGLVHERLDAAFVRSPVGRTPGLRIDALLEEPMLVALPVGHRLAKKAASRLLLTELAMEPFILYRRTAGPGLYDTIVMACREAGFSPRVTQEAPRLTATLSLVAAGFGISLVPASMQRLGGEDIVYRAVAGSSKLVAPLLLAMRQTHPAPAVAQLRSLVQRMLPAYQVSTEPSQ
ncbi:LysR family transcriptional regulator [Phyllobacterium sp. 628]|uniref:LysR family transcriptional regulator n=1 Tax=Phyllobacterium sp. 628 TaxID=2718938 RepID=UPI00166274E3|nr:LysR family transcriptional regulator [Phyllobacterium sp. 628]QND51173.1 LysR family transcriptional regulator [Phyllobacterium sp. 628]